MRILYVTAGFPFPLTSGYIRHYHLIRALSARHRVTLLSFVGRTFRTEHEASLRPFTEGVRTVEANGVGRSKLGRAWGVLRSVMPSASPEHHVAEMQGVVRRCFREGRFDVVLSSERHTPFLPECSGVPLVVDLCDATSMGIRKRLRHAGVTRFPTLALEYVAVRRAERVLRRRADHLLFATERDRDAVMGGAQEKSTVIPNGVDLDYWRRTSSMRGQDTIVMSGAMDYAPNRDAAMLLIRDILPRVRRTIPDARLWIVGRDARADLIRAARQAGATVTGFVEDVRPYLERASVAAAPLRFGAGVQNKLLEAMAMGMPAVVSPLAAEGLRTEQGEGPPLRVASHPHEFAARIVEDLLRTRDDPRPDHTARDFVERNYVWARSGVRLEQLLDSLAGRTR